MRHDLTQHRVRVSFDRNGEYRHCLCGFSVYQCRRAQSYPAALDALTAEHLSQSILGRPAPRDGAPLDRLLRLAARGMP